MSLGFSRHHTLHISLDKALLVEPGHKAAEVIGRGPEACTQLLVPSLTAPLRTSSLTGSFIEECT